MDNSNDLRNETSSKWYDNKVIVGILIIVFFPVGLYALWKSTTITKGWKVGWSIIICIFAISLIGSEDNKDLKTEIANDNKSESNEVDISKKLNVSYDQALENISNSIEVEELNSWNELPAYLGRSTDNNNYYYINIVGRKDNISIASLFMPVPSNKTKDLSESAILKQFLKNIVPDHQKSLDWITNTYSKLYEQSKNKESMMGYEDSKNFEEKNIKLFYNDGGNELSVSIEHKDLE